MRQPDRGEASAASPPGPRAVLLVINKFDRRSGPDVLVAGLLRRLDRRRWAPSVALIDFGRLEDPCLIEEARPADVAVSLLRWERGRGLPRIAAALARHAADHGAAVVHSHDIPSHLCVSAARLLMRAHRPAFVASVHGIVDQTRRQRIWNRINRVVLPRFDRVIIGSPAMADPFAFLDPARVALVWNAVEMDALAPVGPPAERPPGAALRLVCVGRISAEKGHAVLVDAMRIARDAGVEARLSIIGVGALVADLRARIAAAGLEDRIAMEGFVDDPMASIREADLLVMPSLQESLPLVVLEAMALGVPVLASSAGALPQVVLDGQTGFVVPTGDAPAMAAAIGVAAADREALARMGLAARQRALARHSMEIYAADTAAQYETALGLQHAAG